MKNKLLAHLLVIALLITAVCISFKTVQVNAVDAFEDVAIEAESGAEMKARWSVKQDAGASGGKLIYAKGSKTKNGPPADGTVKYVFEVKKAGKYKVFLRFRATGGGTSIWFSVNGSASKRTEHGSAEKWTWNYLNVDDQYTPVVFNLKAGKNVMIIGMREADFELDKFLISGNPALKAETIKNNQ